MNKLLVTVFLTFMYTALCYTQPNHDEINKPVLDEFDSFMDSIVDELSYSQSHLRYKDFRKWLDTSKDDSKRTNTLALARLLETDPVLKSLVIDDLAIKRMRAAMRDIEFDSIDTKNKQRRILRAISNSKLYFSKNVFNGFEELGLYYENVSTEDFKTKIGYIKNFNTIHYLHVCMKNWIELNSMNEADQNYFLLSEKLQILNERLTEITRQNFYKFGYTDISKEKAKDIGVYTVNDYFVGFDAFEYNQDMGHTGGLHLNISTDYLKMRLLPYINGDNILSYQSIDIGFDVFTPYIRDTIPELKLVSYQHDRPFASSLYFGRTKYRLHRKGHVRHTGKFRLVIIGSQTGRYFQELLHKDFTISAIKPVGWSNQISNGGRLGYTIFHKFDFLMASDDASIFKKGQIPFMKYFNPFLSLEGQYSHEKTYIGSSINLSSRNFTRAAGNHLDYRLKNLQKTRFDYQLGAQINYIFHNTLLGDFGMAKRADNDPFDDEYLSNYFLPEKQIENWVWKTYAQISYRYRNATLYYSLTFQRKEFKERPLDDVENPDYKKILEDRFNYKSYGYGTIGLIFNI